MKLDALGIGAHPDDVELGCGGTLALLAAAGRKVGVLHLTRGEAGTRGTPEERRSESEDAAAALGAAYVGFLDCGDGCLRDGPAEEDALIEVLRTLRPDLVLGPTPYDRHPDHIKAHGLVQAACFYAGLAGRTPGRGGAPHRPAAVYSYMQHDAFEPRFVVDVTSAWEAKIASLAAHRSQLYQPGGPSAAESGAVTKVSTKEFYLAVEGRARHFGQLIGATYGEPFWSPLPLAVRDPLATLPGGVR